MGRRSSKGPSNDAPSGLIAVGVVRKPHGVRGEASVEPWTNSIERLTELTDVILVSPDEKEQRPSAIASARIHVDRVLIRFAGIDSPEAVRAIQGWSVEIPAEQARELEEGEYFLHDLVGLEVIDERSQRNLGTVVSADDTAGGVLLTVARANRSAFEIPFVTDICKEIDLESRTMRVDLPEGLEDLDTVKAVEDETPGDSAGPRRDEEPREERPNAATGRAYRVDLVTIFPAMFGPLLAEGIIARGLKNGHLDIRVWNLRDFTTDKHKSTDDDAYGGGVGMVMLVEPVFRCVEAIRESGAAEGRTKPHVVMMSPQGPRFTQSIAGELATREWIVILCGRYEGFDERIREALVDEEISVGDFVVSGGEIPAMLVVEAVGRLVEGVVGDRNSVVADSFYNGLLDHPHYTRPAEFRGMLVPEVLISGHAENIRKWRKEQTLRATLRKRPDLLDTAPLDEEAKRMLDRIRGEGEEPAGPDVTGGRGAATAQKRKS